MAQEGVGQSQEKKLHPFFAQPPSSEPASASTLLPTRTGENGTTSDVTSQPADESNDHRRKRQRIEPEAAYDDRTAPKSQHEPISDPVQASEPHDHGTGDVISAPDTVPLVSSMNLPPVPLNDTSIKKPDHDTRISGTANLATEAPANHVQTTPIIPVLENKKVLKFNRKTGTLGSPPKPKHIVTPTRIVCIKYGHDEASRRDLGHKITQILDEGKVFFPSTPPKVKAPRRTPKAKKESLGDTAAASKSTHPFFTGKAKKPQQDKVVESNTARDASPIVKNSVFMSTPVSPKKPRISFPPNSVPRFGSKEGGTKVPGAMHPAWPSKGMVHVRGFEDSPSLESSQQKEDGPSRKSKGSIVTVSTSESLLQCLCRTLDTPSLRKTVPQDDNSFPPPPDELRQPNRHFESGRLLQRRVLKQLRTYRPLSVNHDPEIILNDSEDDEQKKVHPVIRNWFDSLETSLSAYDRSTCEISSWAHKFAPTNASEVLQAGKEAIFLRDWLEKLRVQSVDTGSTDSNAKNKSKGDAAPRKRRKKNQLDGFIVNSDEEEVMMDEVSEDEDAWTPAGPGSSKRTVIRSMDTGDRGNKDQGRLANAIVVSGPHGSGKTAAVYAVAKELGFEIFEINAGSRRSGRDILDRVGDMTRNHLVQQHQAEQSNAEPAEDEVAKDLKSGKQGMMTAFFKPKRETARPKAKASAASNKPGVSNTSAASKNQKQSLILLEEVDVLYEEDKQFWASLTSMMVQSRRPFIMTCNEETLLPLQTLNLHGILRFSPPPVNLAVDLCLLAAANEGHLLQRNSVEALYKSRNYDLRAALTDLNYWCQIGVGDRRGGFDWFVRRLPKGIDLDENGDVVRVISEDTYRKGMDWVVRDPILTCSSSLESESEVMRQCWDSWKEDVGDWPNSLDLHRWSQGITDGCGESKDRLDAIAAYDDFSGALSAADLISNGVFGVQLDELLDPTLPDMPVKSRDDYTIGRKLLEVTPMSHFEMPNRDLSMTLRSLAKSEMLKATMRLDKAGSGSTIQPVSEAGAISILENSFKDSREHMTRLDLAMAFDPIAVSDKAPPLAHLDPSVFDRTLDLIVLDVAPWVRGVVEYDHRLMTERLKLSNLLSEGGKRKRMRNTRSAFSAMEGGERRTTRREKYFGDCLRTDYVRRTAGDAWHQAVLDTTGPVEAMEVTEATDSITSSPPSSTD